MTSAAIVADGRRSWIIEDHGERPLTINRVINLHRQQWAAITKVERHKWCILARQAKVPVLERARITVTPLHANRRSPQDAGACAAAAKAAIDGLVDARVLPDDSPAHLLALTFLAPDICGTDGLRIAIEEAA
jgi:NAD(P)-dependent dehydrogenase (short-subunit alcohol dehydrogenase family)